jgi:ABC-type antimicrobial peptide transport system permease subunit
MINQKLLPSQSTVSGLLHRIEHTIEDEVAIDVLELRKGFLSWRIIGMIALRNIFLSRSRSVITIGAIAIGIGAIIFLVSFSYGLQSLVTGRLVRPNSLRLVDVQSSSTALSVNKKVLADISSLAGVQDTAPAVALAGTIGVSSSKMDAVVVAAHNNYLTYSHLDLVEGRLFSNEADAPYAGTDAAISQLQKAIRAAIPEPQDVAGAQTHLPDISPGRRISESAIRFRIKDMVYMPVRTLPIVSADVLGYARGSVLDIVEGAEVWGDEFATSGIEGKAVRGSDGTWYGKWVKARVALYKEEAPTVYLPITDDGGGHKTVEGYIPQRELHILSREEYLIEKDVEEREKVSDVLGESTLASLAATLTPGTSALVKVVAEDAATEAAALEQMIARSQNVSSQAGRGTSTALGIIEVTRDAPKEAIVSTGMLQTLKKDPRKSLGEKISLEFIVSGGLIPGVDGRVLSKKVEYTVVGVVRDPNKSLVFVPFGDVISMGVDKYSMVKVLASSPESLKPMRDRIESLGFTTQSIVDTIVQVNKLFAIMRYLLASFGIIAFIVAIIGMFNTLTITLLERTREVAVMKTLGTTNHDVSRLFMVESLMLGLVGGIVGTLFGIFLGVGVDALLLLLREDKTIRLFVFPPYFMVLMVLISMTVGIVTGLYPARRSRSISPLDALRYE